MEVLVRVRGRGVLGSVSSNIKTAGFYVAGTIVRTKIHQIEKQHNTIAHEKNTLIKIPFVMLSVDHFISKSLLHTIIKGCNFKRILQCKKYFFFLSIGPFLKIQLTLFINKCGNCIIWKQICMLPFTSLPFLKQQINIWNGRETLMNIFGAFKPISWVLCVQI